MPEQGSAAAGNAAAGGSTADSSAARGVALVSLLALAGLVLLLAAAPIRTNDYWFHLKAGETYAQEGLWPSADPMLHTARPEAPVQHEWLFGVAVYGLHSAIGFQGTRAAHALAVAGVLWLAFSIFRRASGSTLAACAATAAFVALAWWRLIQLRPDLVSIPAALVTYRLLLEDARAPGWGRVAAAIALWTVWANAHSLFAIGPGLVAAALGGMLLERALAARAGGLDPSAAAAWRTRALQLGAALAAGAVATLLNPRGLDQHLTFFTSSRDTAIWRIGDEWMHFDPLSWTAYGTNVSPLAWALTDLLWLAVVVGGAVGLWRCAKRADLDSARALDGVHLALAATAVLSIAVSVRFLWMGAFPLVYLLRAARARDLLAASRVRQGLLVATVAIACAFPPLGGWARRAHALPRSPGDYLGQALHEGGMYLEGFRFLRDSGLEGNLFNRYTQGGYLGYWLAPRLRTFVDGRTEHYAPDVLDDYFRISRGSEVRPGESPAAALARRDVDVFFGVGLPVEGESVYTTTRLERTRGWRLVARGVDHAIWLRDDEDNRVNLERVARYYRERGVPFDPSAGFESARALREAPQWSIEQHLVPEDYATLQALVRGRDLRLRTRAHERLATAYYLAGAYAEQIELDFELIRLRPRARAPKIRLLYGLLRTGRDAEALAVAGELASSSSPPGQRLAVLARALVQQRERGAAEDHAALSLRALDARPLFSQAEMHRYFRTDARRWESHDSADGEPGDDG